MALDLNPVAGKLYDSPTDNLNPLQRYDFDKKQKRAHKIFGDPRYETKFDPSIHTLDANDPNLEKFDAEGKRTGGTLKLVQKLQGRDFESQYVDFEPEDIAELRKSTLAKEKIEADIAQMRATEAGNKRRDAQQLAQKLAKRAAGSSGGIAGGAAIINTILTEGLGSLGGPAKTVLGQ